MRKLFVLILICQTANMIFAHLANSGCGTCVCDLPPRRDTDTLDTVQGRPGKMGPPGQKGDRGVPGEPDVDMVESTVDRKIRRLSESTRKLEETVLQQNTKIEELQETMKTLLLLHQQTDCTDISGPSGVYTVYPQNYKRGVKVFCNQDIDEGGWIVIQRRINGSVDFFRGWDDYVAGFGNLEGEFWIGLEKLHKLTKNVNMELRVDMEDRDGDTAFAEYSTFIIGDSKSQYALTASGYTGDAGDGLATQSGQMFTTKDRDNDKYDDNCAIVFKGAWWYNACHTSNLNGMYYDRQDSSATAVDWSVWRNKHISLRRAEMKIRPLG